MLSERKPVLCGSRLAKYSPSAINIPAQLHVTSQHTHNIELQKAL